MTTINLSEYVGQRIYVKHRDGSEEIDILTKDSDLVYTFNLGRDFYTQSGRYQSDREDPSDIIEISPANKVTVMKWIDYRRPTEEDGHLEEGYIQVLVESGLMYRYRWNYAGSHPWAHCPGWQPPQPEPPSEVQQLRRQLAEIHAKLDQLERGK